MRSFDLSGQHLKEKSFRRDFSGNKVLALSGNILRFLITDKGSRYMRELKLIRIDDGMNTHAEATIDTSKITIEAGRHKISVFDFAFCLKDKFDCTLNFSLNDKLKDILMTCKHKRSGIILAAIVLFENREGLYEATLLTTQEE